MNLWIKAKPGQIMGDGDEILVTGIHPRTRNRWYEIVTVACDEDHFELVDSRGENTDLDWGELDFWCYTKNIPAPESCGEAADAAGGSDETTIMGR